MHFLTYLCKFFVIYTYKFNSIMKYKYIILMFVIFLTTQIHTIFGKNPTAVTITAPTLSNLCVGSAVYTPLGNIVITEGVNNDITGNQNHTLILNMPTGFELQPSTGIMNTLAGGNIVSQFIFVSSNAIFIAFTTDNTTDKPDAITISGLQAKATIVALNQNMIVANGSTNNITGITVGTSVMATFSSSALPTLNVLNSVIPICAGQQVTFTASGTSTLFYFELMQGVTSLNIQNYSATNTYTTSNALAAGNYSMKVIGKDGNGCVSTTSTTNFIINAIPTMTVGNSGTSICQGKTITFTATGTSNYRFELMQGVTSLDIQGYGLPNTYTTSNALLAGSYTLLAWGRDANNCISTLSTTNFTINPLPTSPTITAGNTQSFCAGVATSTVINTTGVGTRRWFNDAGLTSVASSLSNPTLNDLGITSTNFPAVYTYYVVNDNGTCFSNVVIVTITILQSPVVSLTSGDTNYIICQGDPVTFTGTGNATQYSFDLRISGVSQAGFPTAFGVVNTFTTSPSLLANNNYSMIVIGKLANNCETISNIISFQIKTNPSVTFTWPGTTSFVNTDNTAVNLASSVTPTGGVFSGDGIAGNSFTPSVAGSGLHSITYTYTDGSSGCSDSKQVSVSVTTGGFILPSAFCQGDAVTSPLTSGGCTTSIVSANPGSAGAAITPTFAFDPSAVTIPTGQDYVKWEGSIYFSPNTGAFFPCPSYGFYIFTYVFRRPNPIITGTTLVCENTNNVVYSVPAVVGNRYNWTVTGGTIVGSAINNSVTVNWGTAGIGTIQISQTANYTTPISQSCATSVSQNISIIAPPNPNIVPGSGATCEGSTENYSVSSSPSSTYLWTVTGGIIVGANNTNSITITWGAAATGRTISVTQTTFSCSGTDTRNINVRTVPSPTITGSLSVCEAANGINYSVSNVLPPFALSTSYQWTVIGGAIVGSNTNDNVTVNWGSSGTGRVIITQQYNYTSINCSKTSLTNVTINPLPSVAVFVGTGVFCENTTNNNFYTNGVAGDTYVWSVTGGTIASGQGTTSIMVNWGAPGNANVSLVKTNSNGCASLSPNNFTIRSKPSPSIISSAGFAVCANKTGLIYNTNPVVGNTYTWSAIGGTIVGANNTNSVTIDWGVPDPLASITITETNSAGCIHNFTRNINILPLPNPPILGSLAVCANATNVNYTTSGSGTFVWAVTGGTIISGQNTNVIAVNWGAAGTGNVSITNTNINGCVGSNSSNVTINALPAPTISGAASVCAGKTGEVYNVTSSANRSYLWSVSGGIISGTNTNNIVTIDWGTSNSGSLQIIETNTLTNCAVTTTRIITINPLPNPIITGNTNVCTGIIRNYSVVNGVNQTYNWVVTGGTINSGQGTNNIQVTWGSAGIGNISITQTDNVLTPNCSKNISQPISILPLPNPNIIGNISVCASSIGVQYSTALSAGNIYIWSVTNGTITIGQGSDKISVDWAAAGTGQVSVTQTDINGCTKSINQSITVNPLPTPIITQNSGSLCENTPGNIFSVPSSMGRNYTWSVIGGTITSGQGSNNINITWGNATNIASVSVVETVIATTCSGTTTNNVIIIPKPTPNVTSVTTSVCANQMGVIYSTPQIIGNSYLWSITGGTITAGQNTNQITVNWGLINPSASISVTETAANGCIVISSKSIIINPLPTPSVSGDIVVCQGSTNNVYSTNFVSGNSYFWTVVGGVGTSFVGQNTNQITVTWGAAGSGTVSVLETIITTNCKVSQTRNINISPLPTPTIANNSAVCANSTNNIYSTNLVAGNTYLWDVTNGIIISGQNTNQISVTWGSTATGIVKVTQTITATSCVKVMTQNIVINPLPTPNIIGGVIGTNNVCATLTYTYRTPNIMGHTYNWTVTNGTFTGQGTNQISVTWGNSSVGIVELTQTNTLLVPNCSKYASVDVIILPLPTPSIIGAGVVCQDNKYAYSTTLIAGHTYIWEVNNGTIVSGTGTNAILVVWDDVSATQFVKVTQISSNTTPNCSQIAQIPVVVNPVPYNTIVVANTCYGEITTFTPSSTQPDWIWEWVFPDNTTSNVSNPSKIFPTAGNFSVKAKVTNQYGCFYEQNTIPLAINPVPVANFRHSGTCLGSTTQFINLSTLATTNVSFITQWSWDFGDGSPILVGNFPNPTHSFVNPGVYDVKLIVTSNRNCSHTITKKVIIFPFFAPTDTTPYNEAFETTNHGWVSGSYNGLNSWGTVPNVPLPSRTVQGSTGKIWSTGLSNNYANAERSYVESPCFDLQGLTRPMLTIKKWSDSEVGLDGTVILYTIDEGTTWKVLGDINEGLYWYNQNNILSTPGPGGEINQKRSGWTGKDNAWIDARFALDAVKADAGANSVRFRIAFSSNADNLPGRWDGFAFDDVRILNRDGKVLLEHFTNMSSVVENESVNLFSPETVKLQYHTNLANDNDKLYQENRADGGARALFYGISEIARAAMNGKANTTQQFSNWAANAYSQNALNSPRFDVKLTFPSSPTNTLNINVAVKANLPYTKPVVVHIVLVEKQVTSTQLGVTGTTIYKNIVRKMLPSAGGTLFSSTWAVNQVQNFSQNISIYAMTQENGAKFYDWNNLSVVAFVQDYETKEVYQADQNIIPIILPTLISGIEDELKKQCWIYPNPTSDEVFIGFKDEVVGDYQWEIYSMQGVKISQGIINEGEKGVKIDVTKYPKSMYIIKIINPRSQSVWQSKLEIR